MGNNVFTMKVISKKELKEIKKILDQSSLMLVDESQAEELARDASVSRNDLNDLVLYGYAPEGNEKRITVVFLPTYDSQYPTIIRDNVLEGTLESKKPVTIEELTERIIALYAGEYLEVVAFEEDGAQEGYYKIIRFEFNGGEYVLIARNGGGTSSTLETTADSVGMERDRIGEELERFMEYTGIHSFTVSEKTARLRM